MRKTIKKTLWAILLIQNSYAWDLQLKVDEYKTTNYEFIHEIKNERFYEIKLDCQGFINAIDFKDELGRDLGRFILDIGECQDIHRSIVEFKERDLRSCIKLDFQQRLYEVDEHSRCE